jgi:translation elongation factor EF-Tu-like GTPase
MSKRIEKTLEKTKFCSSPIVAVSAKPGGSDDNNEENIDKSNEKSGIGLKLLLDTICDQISIPKRSPKGELVLSVDHCFSIRGSGTVMTGTILQGSVCVNDVCLLCSNVLFIDFFNVLTIYRVIQQIDNQLYSHFSLHNRISKFLPLKSSKK